jgi:hypothetical protein
MVRALLAGRIAVGIGRPTFMGEAPVPSIALAIELPGSPVAEEAVQQLEGMVLSMRGPAFSRQEITIEGERATALVAQRGFGTLLHARVDGLWLASNSQGYLRDCVRALRGKAPSLGAGDLAVRGRELSGKGTLASGFTNLRPAAELLGPWLPYEVCDVARAVGVTTAPELFVGFGHTGKNGRDVWYLDLPGPKEGLFKALLNRPATCRAARWCGPETAVFASASIDGPAFAAAVEEVVAALPARIRSQIDREFHRKLFREIDRGLHHAGLSPEEVHAFASCLGNEVTFALEVPKGSAPIPLTTAFIELRDEAKARELLQGLLPRVAGGQTRAEEASGTTVHTFSVPPLSPSFAIKDGMLLATNFKTHLKRMLQAGARAQGSLADAPDFAERVRRAEGASVVVIGRPHPVLDNTWGLIDQMLQIGIDATQGGLEIEQLPTKEAVAAALDDLTFTVKVDAAGIAVTSESPLATGTLIALLGRAVDWVLGVEVGHASAESRPAAGAPRRRIY